MIKIFEKKYEGFESLASLEEDVLYAFNPQFNQLMKNFNSEFTDGKVKVIIEADESCFKEIPNQDTVDNV